MQKKKSQKKLTISKNKLIDLIAYAIGYLLISPFLFIDWTCKTKKRRAVVWVLFALSLVISIYGIIQDDKDAKSQCAPQNWNGNYTSNPFNLHLPFWSFESNLSCEEYERFNMSEIKENIKNKSFSELLKKFRFKVSPS